MNIYTILMSKDKCQTFFPKLSSVKKPSRQRQSSSHATKKSSNKKLRNNSIDLQGRLRLTYHDILQTPISTSLIKQQLQPIQTGMRKTFVKKPSQPLKINNYSIVREIGKGGFTQVFQVADQNNNKYAMKQYLLQNSIQCYKNQYIVGEHFFDKGKLRSKFAQKRGGNYLINYIEKIRIGNGRKGFIIQELGGISLSKALSQIHGVFYKGQRVYQVAFTKFYEQLQTKNMLAKILLQIAEGIKLLNEQGFTHCDLKPQNILISNLEQVPLCKIIDFGSAFPNQSGLPKITITPQYMPPELLKALESDSPSISPIPKIDIWSLGCILLQIVTGVPLWFRYKCKLTVHGKQVLQLGPFALANREYRKIIKKQKEICEKVNERGSGKIGFINGDWEKYRRILGRMLVFQEENRADVDEVIGMLEELIKKQ